METRKKAMLHRAGIGQQDLSRSLHALEYIDSAGAGLSQRAAQHPAALRRQKSETELPVNEAVFSFADERRSYHDSDRPVLRRRRFTRKQRKSVTIDPETSLILATGNQSTSSSDDEEQPRSRSSSRHAGRLNKSRGLSVSVNALAPKEEAKPEKKKSHPRGPAARRAGRRSALQKSQVAASATNLDQFKSSASSQLRTEKRSMSVRDLNGEEFDFSNKDSVTRWTSQILAELDSLPSSCVDLTARDKFDNYSRNDRIDGTNRKPYIADDSRRFSTLQTRPSATAPPVPPHRQSMFESQPSIDRISTYDLMTSSVIEPMTTTFGSANSASARAPKQSDFDLTSSIDSVDSWISSFENLMTSSFQGSIYSLRSDGSAPVTRDREDSNATTLVALSSESEDEEGTPLALTPVPMEELPLPTSSDKSSSTEGMTGPVLLNHNDRIKDRLHSEKIPVSPKPIPAVRTVLSERNGAQKTIVRTPVDHIPTGTAGKSVQINGVTRHGLNEHVTSTMPRAAKEFGVGSPGSVRRRQFNLTPLEEVDKNLSSSIARLSQSVYGEINCEPHPEALNRFSIPLVRTDRWASEQRLDAMNDLEKWKKRAQCRSREHHDLYSMNEPRSVNRVVASLIRSIEDSRYSAPDRPAQVTVDSERGQDAATQTSPFSISRSSSFDWINEPTEGGLRDLKTPLSTPRSERLPQLPTVSKQVESSSETDDADREVAEMTQNVEGTESRCRQDGVVVDRDKDKLFAEMDESIQMLLEYGQPVPKPPPRRNLPREKSNDSNSLTFSHASTDSKATSDSLPSDSRRSAGGSSIAMTESIYDNMPKDRRKKSQDSPLPKPRIRQPSIGSVISSENGSAKMTPEQTRKSIKSMEAKSNNQYANLTALTVPSLTGRAGSCETLAACPNEPDNYNLAAKLKSAEEDALECCHWLRQAGFPQYAKQYQEGRFPIDIRSVQSDHEFLGPDSLRALYRRLNTLNRCAIMRIDQVVLRRRNDGYGYGMYDTYDDDDSVALSGNWRYQRHSHTWSRVGSEQMYGVPGRTVCPKPNWDTYRDQVDPRHRYELREMRDPYPGKRSDRQLERYAESADCNGNAAANKLQRSHSERIKERARAIMKKMDLRSSSRRRKDSRHRDPTCMVIGDPVLVSYDSASPETMRMVPRPSNLDARNGRTPAGAADRHSRSKSARRQGMVVLSPSSPDSSDDSFLSSHHRRPAGPSVHTRRDRSVPPQLIETEYEYAPHERLRRERNPYDSYLYPAASPNSLTRTATAPSRPNRRALQQCAAAGGGYDAAVNGSSPYYGSGGYSSSPAYSSPYSTRSYQSPPVIARNLVIQPDGYFMHDVSPDTSLSRLRPPRSESPSTSSGVPQLRVDTHANKSESSLDNTDEEQSSGTTTMNHNRRDSGVGSSLSRSPSGPSSQRLRQSILPYSTNSFSFLLNTNHVGSLQSKRRAAERSLMSSSIMSSCSSDDAFFTDVQLARCVDSLSVSELARLNKLAYLRVTAILEKHMGPGSTVKIGDVSPTQNGVVKNWTVQKLFKKIKMDGKTGKEIEIANQVFGQPLTIIYKRSGLCLPRTILEILRYLRQMAPDTVGIFRKNGVKSRILEVRMLCDRDAEADVFVDENRLDPGQVHDVADTLKQYLRELPEPLMTTRLSETFANIFIHVPENERLLALQYAILLLPDENREALQTLLLFLSDVSKHADSNSMPAQNLAVCFTPSLFQLSASRLDKITPTRRHKTIGAAGMPTEREMRETRAAQQCLTFMIQNCRNVFVAAETGPEDRIQAESDAPLLKELGLRGPRAFLIDRVNDLIRDHADRWKSWILEGFHEDIEISCKMPNEDHPLRLFRVWVDVAAPPKQVMNRVMRERNVWDTSVVNWRTIDVLQAPDTDLHQYVLNDTVGHPTRDCFVARFHKADLSEIRGACAIAERSVQCSEAQLLGGTSAAVLDSHFLIEPKAGHSRVTYISRIDLRGRGPAWYNKVYGNIVARQMIRLRESFQSSSENIGPETKV